MARRTIHGFIIPAREGRAVEVMKGQVLGIRLVEDKQVGDCAFFNLHDLPVGRCRAASSRSWRSPAAYAAGRG